MSRADHADFWATIRRSTDLVRGLPAWTSAGIVLSCNFEGGRHRFEGDELRCVHCGERRE